jgi:hypothetical protein
MGGGPCGEAPARTAPPAPGIRGVDVLALYRGAIHEFFVTRGDPRVEIECADLDLFRAVAEQPCHVGLHGVMELAKIAQARLLWGPPGQWQKWRSQVLRRAVKNGLVYWRVLSVGLRLHQAKYGIMLARFTGSLAAVLEAAHVPNTGHAMFGATDETFAEETAALLDKTTLGWRTRIARDEPLFEPQPPEVWSALHLLAGQDRPRIAIPIRAAPTAEIRAI